MGQFAKIRLTGRAGRLGLCLTAMFAGTDLLVTLVGGAAHIGAIALADQTGVQVLERDGHRERELAESVARLLVRATAGRPVAVICGIHYSRISAGEIEVVRRLARTLTCSLVAHLGERTK